MPLTQCKHWIFDMDGTLTVSVHDFDAIRTELNIRQGAPILEAIAEMPEKQSRAATIKLHDIEMQIAASTQPQPGAVELLDLLAEKKYSLGILTRNACDIADATLEQAGLSGYFEKKCILGRESCAAKPDPAGIEILMAQWNAAPEESVMTGDYRFDLEAGHRAGTHTVHLDVNKGEQWPAMTTVRVTSLVELAGLIS